MQAEGLGYCLEALSAVGPQIEDLSILCPYFANAVDDENLEILSEMLANDFTNTKSFTLDITKCNDVS